MQNHHPLAAMALLAALASAPGLAASYPAYQEGQSYSAGDIVSNGGSLYQCREWPYSGWCSGSAYHYAPGTGASWQDAWTLYQDGGSTDPGLTLASPADGATIEQGSTLAIVAGFDGPAPALLRILVDGTLLGEVSAAPWQLSWPAASLGSHSIRLEAVDDSGVVLAEASATVTVTAPQPSEAPQISIQSPAAGANLTLGQQAWVSAQVSDANDDVDSVSLYLYGALVATDTSAPWQLAFTPAALGQAQLQLKATDSQGLEGQSAVVAVQVVEATPPPTGGNLSCDITQIYKADGQECMGDDHGRRVIGYFTSWRTGKNGLPAFLVPDIPWSKVTHINYAFAGIDEQSYQLRVDDAATNMTWPGVAGAEMDPAYSYTGHFNLLNKFKKQYPDVKTLISVGGWADTGGFYPMTTKADCSVNNSGIETFADSAVAFIRQYGFDGVDIDYEYPTSMKDAGNPNDFALSNACRSTLFANYVVLMKKLRDKLDAAGSSDDRRYMLTIASPASAYLLRGMENFQVTQYLDYVNLMSYDFHGAWNHFVGHNAALFDNNQDAELAYWGVYNQAQFGGIGYLNAAWGAHYFRGALAAGKINIGVPYYTRGWQSVTGGDHGLGGKAALPNQSDCQPGTGTGTVGCGYGAEGIDNIWHDEDLQGSEIGGGTMPLWHALNLLHAQELGIDTMPSYGSLFGLDPAKAADVITGQYVRYYDNVAKAPWLWNEQKKVFLSTEDEQSMAAKLDYVVQRGLGGVMFWEMAGDYAFDAAKNEYGPGDTLTTLAYNRFANAAPANLAQNDLAAPAAQLDLALALSGFKDGDANYPINPTLTLTNHSSQTLPGGAKVSFLVPTSTSDTISDQSGMGLAVTQSGGNDNSEGISNEQDFHQVALTLPAWQALAPGASVDVALVYYLPAAGVPSGVRIEVAGQTLGLKADFPSLPEAVLGGGNDGGDGDGGTGSGDCAAQGVDQASYPAYPNWPQLDWAGNPDHANQGDRMTHSATVWQAKWWTQATPGSSDWTQVCSY